MSDVDKKVKQLTAWFYTYGSRIKDDTLRQLFEATSHLLENYRAKKSSSITSMFSSREAEIADILEVAIKIAHCRFVGIGKLCYKEEFGDEIQCSVLRGAYIKIFRNIKRSYYESYWSSNDGYRSNSELAKIIIIIFGNEQNIDGVADGCIQSLKTFKELLSEINRKSSLLSGSVEEFSSLSENAAPDGVKTTVV